MGGGGCTSSVPPISFLMVRPLIKIVFKPLWRIDCEQSLFGQSRLSSAGLERANSRERGKRECEASESRGEAGEKAGKEGGTAFSFEPDVFR